MGTHTMQLTKTQIKNLLALWDSAIAARASELWEENGGHIVEYEDAFEEACSEYCITEGHMNEALYARQDEV